MESCCLAFFATLFADRHGTILSLDSQSTVSSMVLSLYSGFNRFIPFRLSQTVQQNAALNAIGHHLLPSSPQSLSTLQTVVRFFLFILLRSFTPSISPSLFLPIPQTIRFMSSKSSVTSIFLRFTRRSTRPKHFFARAFFPLSGKRAFRQRNRCICCRFEALD